MKVRKAQISDAPSIISIQAEGRLSVWSESDYEEEARRADSIFMVATVEESAPVGFIVGRVAGETTELTGQAEIYNVGVTNVCRRLGVGSLLLRAFLTECWQRGVKIVFLEVRSSNGIAQQFYGRHGFTNAGERPNFYTDPVENATLMQLDLRTAS